MVHCKALRGGNYDTFTATAAPRSQRSQSRKENGHRSRNSAASRFRWTKVTTWRSSAPKAGSQAEKRECVFEQSDQQFEDLPYGTCIVGELPMRRPNTLSIKQELMALSTAWTTRELFSDTAFTQKYVAQFVRLYNESVGAYLESHGVDRDAFVLIYKGGNVITDYISNLTLKAERDNMTALLTRSDVDFQVFVSDDRVYQHHIVNVSKLVVRCAYKLRAWLRATPQFARLAHVPLPNYPPVDDSHRPIDASRAARLDSFILRHDSPVLKEVVSNSNTNTNIKRCSSVVVQAQSLLDGMKSDIEDPLYVTYNDSLRFMMQGMDGVASFDLVRMKYNIDVSNGSCTAHAPGEVLDVSISTPDDFKTVHARKVSLGDWTRLRSDGVRVPTIEYLAKHDLHNIMFEEQSHPWNDTKYNKRLARYVLMLQLLDVNVDKLSDSILYSYNDDANMRKHMMQVNNRISWWIVDAMHHIPAVQSWLSLGRAVPSEWEKPPGERQVGPHFLQLCSAIQILSRKINSDNQDMFEAFIGSCSDMLDIARSATQRFCTEFRDRYFSTSKATSKSTK